MNQYANIDFLPPGSCRKRPGEQIHACDAVANVPTDKFTLATLSQTSWRTDSRLRRCRKRPGEQIHVCDAVANVPATRFTLATIIENRLQYK
jgi:hypothetical protein